MLHIAHLGGNLHGKMFSSSDEMRDAILNEIDSLGHRLAWEEDIYLYRRENPEDPWWPWRFFASADVRSAEGEYLEGFTAIEKALEEDGWVTWSLAWKDGNKHYHIERRVSHQPCPQRLKAHSYP